MTGQIKEIHFDGSNYETWSIRMEFYLMSKGLWSVVDPEDEDLDSRRKDSEWRNMNLRAKGKIGLTLSIDVAKQVRHLKTAMSIWHYLKQVYDKSDSRDGTPNGGAGGNGRNPSMSIMSSASTMVPIEPDDSISHYGSPSLKPKHLHHESSLSPQQSHSQQKQPKSHRHQVQQQLQIQRMDQQHHQKESSRHQSSHNHHPHHYSHVCADPPPQPQRGRSRSLPDIPSPDGSVTGSILSRASSPQGSIGEKKSALWSVNRLPAHSTPPPSYASTPTSASSVSTITPFISRESEIERTNTPTAPVNNTGSSSSKSGEWWLMTTAPHHMCKDRDAFLEYEKLKKPFCISFPDGTHVYAIGKGSLSLTSVTKEGKRTILTKNVYYVPDIRKNVLSVASTVKLGNSVEFGDGEATLYTASRDVLATAVMDPKQNGYRLRLATTNVPRNDAL